jgi:cytochrome P450
VFLTFGAGIVALPNKLPYTAYGRAIAARDRLREHVARAVREYTPAAEQHVLARLAAARHEGERLSEEELRIELLHFFVAAHGALQAGLVHLTRALCEHRDVAERTRQAVLDGDRAFVRRVTKEARRAYKIAPTTFFAVAKKDCEVLGRSIKKGWKAVGIIHSTMREASTFARPASFDPDRFADGDPKGYVAHGTGPWSGHRCAGEALADMVLDAFVSVALRDYALSLPSQDMTELPAGFGPMPADGLRLRVERHS